MKPFEDVFARRNRTTSVSDRQHHVAAVAMRANPNSPARTIVLPRVLQEILHDQRCVALLSSHKKSARKFLFNLHVRRISQGAKVIQPFIDELAKIHWFRCDLKVTRIHARQQKQIVNYAGQPTCLMQQSGQLLVDFRLKSFSFQQ